MQACIHSEYRTNQTTRKILFPFTNKIFKSQVYAICPPTVPNREELLDRDPKTGIAYPKDSSKVLRKTMLGSWRYWRGGVVVLYTWVLLVGSAWL